MSYCKVYLDDMMPTSDVYRLFEQSFRDASPRSDFEYTLFPNDRFLDDADPSTDTYPSDRSKYYAEIDSDDERAALDVEFRDFIVRLMIDLRAKFEFAAASCDFEDYIVEQAGWS